MEINKDTICEIFRNNFSFDIVDTNIGRAIKMNSYDAFIFANITGAGYFDNPVMPYTPKGLLKVFREAFNYNLIRGIFNETALSNTPIELNRTKPYIFQGDKYIVLKEFVSEIALGRELRRDYTLLNTNGEITTDYLILRIEAIKKGNGMEPFLEYLACEWFKRRGYIVENQIPLTYNVGTPDFSGYKLRSCANGFDIIELAMMRLFNNFDIAENLDISHVIVGEAKTSTTKMAGQLEKYMNTTLFSEGYEMHPDKRYPTYDYFGLFNIDTNYIVNCLAPANQYTHRDCDILDREQYFNWFKNYMKFYITANMSNYELESYVLSKQPGIYTQEKIIDVICRSTKEELINYIMGVC